ncbi:MAG: heme-binding protein [Myxococcaceae bacterium]|nr:heme-binding protein [Myxococcaceae bacterium]
MATEQPAFKSVERTEAFEIRDYGALVVAETTVEGPQLEAGNEGFRRLAGYIFGGNRGEKRIAMTAPVNQSKGLTLEPQGPAAQTSTKAGTWLVQFTMPAGFTVETLPEPNDSRVTLRTIPARRVAVRQYSGRWTDTQYLKELTALRTALERAGYRTRGEPTWARYDPPIMPFFLRTNEVQLEVESGPAKSGS